MKSYRSTVPTLRQIFLRRVYPSVLPLTITTSIDYLQHVALIFRVNSPGRIGLAVEYRNEPCFGPRSVSGEVTRNPRDVVQSALKRVKDGYTVTPTRCKHNIPEAGKVGAAVRWDDGGETGWRIRRAKKKKKEKEWNGTEERARRRTRGGRKGRGERKYGDGARKRRGWKRGEKERQNERGKSGANRAGV